MSRLRVYYEGVFADGVRYPGYTIAGNEDKRWAKHMAGKTNAVSKYAKEHGFPVKWEVLFCFDMDEVRKAERIGHDIGVEEDKTYMYTPGLPLTTEACRKGYLAANLADSQTTEQRSANGRKANASMTPEQRKVNGRKGGLMQSKEHMAELGRISGRMHSKEHMAELGRISGRMHSREYLAEICRE